MAKTRKTRKQKKLADLRHTPAITRSVIETPPSTESPLEKVLHSSPLRVNTHQSSSIISPHDLLYIRKDLVKVSILTISIVIAEIVLSYALTSWR